VIDAVDEHHILYTSIAHMVHARAFPVLKTRDELLTRLQKQRQDQSCAGMKGEWGWEGQQRDSIHQYAPDADVILALDADEVWSEAVVDMPSTELITCIRTMTI